MDFSFEPEIYFLAPKHQQPWVQTQGTQSSSNRLGFKPKAESSSRLKTTAFLASLSPF